MKAQIRNHIVLQEFRSYAFHYHGVGDASSKKLFNRRCDVVDSESR